MHKQFKKFEINGDLHRRGWDFSICVEFIHPQHGYRIFRQNFAIWWARGSDCGIFIRGIGTWGRSLRAVRP